MALWSKLLDVRRETEIENTDLALSTLTKQRNTTTTKPLCLGNRNYKWASGNNPSQISVGRCGCSETEKRTINRCLPTKWDNHKYWLLHNLVMWIWLKTVLLFSFPIFFIYYSCLLQEISTYFFSTEGRLCNLSHCLPCAFACFHNVHFVTKQFCYVQVFNHRYFGILEKNCTLWGSATAVYHGTYISVYIFKPQPHKMKETKHFHYMKIQQSIMPVKVTFILLVYLRARTPTHLACCHVQLGKVMSHAQQAVLILHLF